MSAMNNIKRKDNFYKTSKKTYFKDVVFGNIGLTSEEKDIIDSPEFQRLRNIKQLGNTEYEFPSAVHSRFLHSIQVMHLCGKFYKVLMKNTPEIKKEYGQYIRHVRIAGLLHDLGHGPKSHIFEEAMKFRGINFHHEDYTLYLINRMNDRLQIFSEEDLKIIQAMIEGKVLPKYKPFLFKIIANKDNGLDFDKIAYLNQDSFSVGMPGVDIDVIMDKARVTDGEIVFHINSKAELENIYTTRRTMFEKVYFHPTVQNVDKMFICAIKQIHIDEKDPDFVFKLDDNVLMNLMEDMEHHSIEALNNRDFIHRCDKCPQEKLERKAKLCRETDHPMLHVKFYK